MGMRAIFGERSSWCLMIFLGGPLSGPIFFFLVSWLLQSNLGVLTEFGHTRLFL